MRFPVSGTLLGSLKLLFSVAEERKNAIRQAERKLEEAALVVSNYI